MTENELARAAEGVEVLGELGPGFDRILSPEAIGLVAMLERRFGDERRRLLARREEVQARLDAGEKPDFLAETAAVRAADWRVAPLPDDLLDRRVEITGPVDRKMVINALNSGASVFMADFEDATTPTWSNLIEGHINLRDAVRREIEFRDPNSGKEYSLADKTATLLVRPRGWHLQENHVAIEGRPISASLFDFGLYFFHNARALLQRGSGPYFYLPKLESHLEARLWNDVFVAAQEALGVPQGSIKATVLIETILAAFEMDEILYELRQHSAGLNCGRWDYIFSFIKKFRHDPACVLPDRAEVGMTRHLMRSYSLLTIKTCHHRGVHAIGGMAAQIPIKNDAEANEEALAKVRADKEREAGDGHDGTWVAHPGLVPIAKAIFDDKMPEANQIARQRQDVATKAADLLEVPEGPITEAGLRQNVNVGIRYLEAWLRGVGCVPLYNLMEDAATAEISRSQVWQWIRHGASLDDGRVIDRDLFQAVLEEEMAGIKAELGDEAYAASRFEAASGIFAELITTEDFVDFLTLPAYEMVAAEASAGSSA
ncbi:MAG TPA: malate synthase A [Alphaproteobacteria bacterium]|jgi:malate synthase|nr:malate synthase A [Alphaproteobacteria bacterium]MDP6271810.1 malate synthase A [Alphaproteobacteria bacterium]MDP7163766.1 malate synthase A [Alphaproteobacteria bacterium]HJM52259.1 malate synthase A [Alphaproteobacteria bacterium]|tara:strand:- start:163 stop:1797 length:1635 start_codon:yes stop_codon:yes gene_type:complete